MTIIIFLSCLGSLFLLLGLLENFMMFYVIFMEKYGKLFQAPIYSSLRRSTSQSLCLKCPGNTQGPEAGTVHHVEFFQRSWGAEKGHTGGKHVVGWHPCWSQVGDWGKLTRVRWRDLDRFTSVRWWGWDRLVRGQVAELWCSAQAGLGRSHHQLRCEQDVGGYAVGLWLELHRRGCLIRLWRGFVRGGHPVALWLELSKRDLFVSSLLLLIIPGEWPNLIGWLSPQHFLGLGWTQWTGTPPSRGLQTQLCFTSSEESSSLFSRREAWPLTFHTLLTKFINMHTHISPNLCPLHMTIFETLQHI